ncbi:MAG: hypothetical protein ACE366_19100 [Bradymonadia bacterium]
MFTYLALSILASTVTEPTPVLEIAIYTVHTPDAFAEIQKRAHRDLKNVDGYQSSLALRSANQKDHFADVVLWRSLAEAKAAAAAMEKHPKMASFMAGIKTLEVMTHVHPQGTDATLPEALVNGQVLEMAVSKVPSAETFMPLQKEIHSHLRTLKPVVAATPLVPAESGVFIDMITWSDQPSAHQVGEKMMADPKFKSFFAAAPEPPVVFDFFVHTP